MNLGRAFTALLVTHGTVGVVAWLNGWIVGRLLARRSHELEVLAPAPEYDFVDLVDRRPYDWERDGAGVVGPAVGVFEWPAGVTVSRPYPGPERAS